MANYHVLNINDRKDQAQVIFHIAVPDEVNAVGTNLRTALQQYLLSSNPTIETAVPWGIGTELADLQSGALYEKAETVEFDANDTVANKRTVIDMRYTALSIGVPDVIRERFKFWGLNRNV